jgi:hypothetical protein
VLDRLLVAALIHRDLQDTLKLQKGLAPSYHMVGVAQQRDEGNGLSCRVLGQHLVSNTSLTTKGMQMRGLLEHERHL